MGQANFWSYVLLAVGFISLAAALVSLDRTLRTLFRLALLLEIDEHGGGYSLELIDRVNHRLKGKGHTLTHWRFWSLILRLEDEGAVVSGWAGPAIPRGGQVRRRYYGRGPHLEQVLKEALS